MACLAYIALGANIGDRVNNLRGAIHSLAQYPGVVIAGCSTVFQTKPVGVLEQPLFLNMVIAVRTDYSPYQLFRCMMETEQKLGRTRDVHWGPRTIDLDLLWFGEDIINTEQLTVPHPHMMDRAFVLAPLLELVALFSPEKYELINQNLQNLPDKGDVQSWMTIDWQIVSDRSVN